jgi:p-hydroxybenzoate 3-monooxygenase
VRPHDSVDNWSDDRIWSEMHARLENRDGWKLKEGKIFQKNIIGMRSFVSTPDAVGPPVPGRRRRPHRAADRRQGHEPGGVGRGAAGARLEQFYRRAAASAWTSYTEDALKRVWRAEYFSWWMTSMLHTFATPRPSSAKCSAPSWTTWCPRARWRRRWRRTTYGGIAF